MSLVRCSSQWKPFVTSRSFSCQRAFRELAWSSSRIPGRIHPSALGLNWNISLFPLSRHFLFYWGGELAPSGDGEGCKWSLLYIVRLHSGTRPKTVTENLSSPVSTTICLLQTVKYPSNKDRYCYLNWWFFSLVKLFPSVTEVMYNCVIVVGALDYYLIDLS